MTQDSSANWLSTPSFPYMSDIILKVLLKMKMNFK